MTSSRTGDMVAHGIMQKFQSFDRDSNGFIDQAELSWVMKQLNPGRWTDAKLSRLFRVLDLNSDNRVDYAEFVGWAFGAPGVSTKDLNSFRSAVAHAERLPPKPKATSAPSRPIAGEAESQALSIAGEQTALAVHEQGAPPSVQTVPGALACSGTKRGVSAVESSSAALSCMDSKVIASKKAAASASEDPGPEDSLQFSVQVLSGKSATLSTRTSASPLDVCISIEKLVGIPVSSQQWVIDGCEILFQQATSMADTGIQHGAQLLILHSGFAPLVVLPDAFALTLTSVRHTMKVGCRSSTAFPLLHNISACISEEWLYFEPWRKNDHDKILIDVKAGEQVRIIQHWMGGARRHSEPLYDWNPLKELCSGWGCPSRRITVDDELFWRATGSDREDCCEDEELEYRSVKQTRPRYSALPGWFVAPSEGYNEIEVDIPLPAESLDGEGGNMRIIRLLMSREGKPERAAVAGCGMACMHEDIEEFEICLESREELAKPTLS